VRDGKGGEAHGVALRRGEADLRADHGVERRQRPGVAPEVEVVRHRRRLARGAGVAVRLPDHHQFVQGGHRRRAQQHAVDDAEDRGDGADGDRQREDDGNGHRRAGGNRAKGLTKVGAHGLLPDGAEVLRN
jgi:hypothetical protein